MRALSPRTRRLLPAALLAWYDSGRRDLPWRAPPGERADPYRVWLSEVMLQQTTVAAVAPYYARFLARWPTVAALAAAPVEDVLAEWAGLGYYARARNLHRCAGEVAARGGRFPDTEAELAALPGIGPYTAAAIAAIAFDRPATPVDGNVERVVARLRGVEEPLPGARPLLRRLAAEATPARRAGDYAQASMDLGATVCTPRRPKCPLCPWRGDCAARASGIAAELPRRAPRPERPTRRGTAFRCVNARGEVLLRRRPARGLLGGTMEIPSSAWVEGPAPDPARAADSAPLAAEWRALPGAVRHGFTHFRLELTVLEARLADSPPAPPGAVWHPLSELGRAGLSSAMMKAVRHGRGQG